VAASLPPAPGRGSTTTGWPHACCRCSPTMRENTSGLGPTMILIGRLGKVSAAAQAAGRSVSASARPATLAAHNSPKTLLPRRLPADMIIDECWMTTRRGESDGGSQADPARGDRQRRAGTLVRAVRQRGSQRQSRRDQPRNLYDGSVG